MIAITGYGRPEDQQKALEAGFNLHLTKPVDEKELEKILNETVRVRRPN
jgi:CheY-like chemotaxis protein